MGTRHFAQLRPAAWLLVTVFSEVIYECRDGRVVDKFGDLYVRRT